MTAPTVGALFAGYGGLDLAVEDVFGAHPAWVSEFDKAPSKILATRYPDVPNHGDVTKIKWSPDCPTCGRRTALYHVGPDAHRAYWCHEHGEFPLSLREDEMARTGVAIAEPVDIITGGSPCQDLSHAGKRAGMKAGTRSGLWASMCDAIDIIRPSLVVWENVRGALSAEATAGDLESCEFCVGDPGDASLRALGRVLGDLAELGYDAAWCSLRAADVGAPHGRYRVFVLAWPADPADTGSSRLGEHTGESPAEEARSGGRDLTAGARGLRPDGDRRTAGVVWGSRDWRELTLLKTPTSQLAVNGGSQHPDKRKAGGHGPTLADEVEHLLPTPQAHDSVDGKTAAQVADMRARTEAGVWNLNEVAANELAAAQAFGQYAPAIGRWERVLGRPAPSPTEPTGKGGAQRLSPAFVEWMMGLPPGWVTDVDITRNEQLKALGNGVVPQQCAAALRHLWTVKESA